MSKIEDLRNSLTSDQVSMIDTIWSYFNEHLIWMPVRVLHKGFGGKAKVQESLRLLNTQYTIVSSTGDPVTGQYHLSLLGVLLSSAGKNIMEQLSAYLLIAKTSALQNPQSNGISSAEVLSQTRLSLNQARVLGYVIGLAPLSSGGTYQTEGWELRFPKDIEDVPDDPSNHIEKIALRTATPSNLAKKENVPVSIAVGKRYNEKVFVVHGRNNRLREDFFAFLRSMSLSPIEWSEAIIMTEKASPYIGEILDKAFSYARAIVVLLSPDDEVRLSSTLWSQNEKQEEVEIRKQARPNVLFEAGMAFGREPDRTLLIEVGQVKPFSDVAGRHVVRLNNSEQRRQDVVNRLKTAGCAVKIEGDDWLTTGDFELPDSGPIQSEKEVYHPVQSEMIVDLDFPADSGFAANMDKLGYNIAWCAEPKLARKLEIEGWSIAKYKKSDGIEVTLRIKDRPNDQILIAKKRNQ